MYEQYWTVYGNIQHWISSANYTWSSCIKMSYKDTSSCYRLQICHYLNDTMNKSTRNSTYINGIFTMNIWHTYSKPRRASWHVSNQSFLGFSFTRVAKSKVRRSNVQRFSAFSLYIESVMCPDKPKSVSLKSGDLGGPCCELQHLTHFPDAFHALGCAEDRNTKHLQTVHVRPSCVLDGVEDVNQTWYFRKK
jgi:hypothetical protein